MLMTDLGAVDATTTMGLATGDLKGAVGATILNIDTQNGGATLISWCRSIQLRHSLALPVIKRSL
jgi:hypothetical protein